MTISINPAGYPASVRSFMYEFASSMKLTIRLRGGRLCFVVTDFNQWLSFMWRVLARQSLLYCPTAWMKYYCRVDDYNVECWYKFSDERENGGEVCMRYGRV